MSTVYSPSRRITYAMSPTTRTLIVVNPLNASSPTSESFSLSCASKRSMRIIFAEHTSHSSPSHHAPSNRIVPSSARLEILHVLRPLHPLPVGNSGGSTYSVEDLGRIRLRLDPAFEHD